MPLSDDHSCILDQNPSQIFCPAKMTKIVASIDHFIGVTEEGEVYVWKVDPSIIQPSDDSPVKIDTRFLPRDIEDISCGGSVANGTAFYLALSSSGTVYSWGDNGYGKLGRQGDDECETPKVVDKLQGMRVVQIHCGGDLEYDFYIDRKQHILLTSLEGMHCLITSGSKVILGVLEL